MAWCVGVLALGIFSFGPNFFLSLPGANPQHEHMCYVHTMAGWHDAMFRHLKDRQVGVANSEAMPNAKRVSNAQGMLHHVSSGLIKSHEVSSGLMKSHEISSHAILLSGSHQVSSGLIRSDEVPSNVIRSQQISCGPSRTHLISPGLIRSHQVQSGSIRSHEV